MVEGQPVWDASAAQSARICTEMRPQNLSNWAWSFALVQYGNIPSMGLIAQAAETATIVNELDLQGLANMAWALSNMQSADSLTFAALGNRLLASPLLDCVDVRADWNRAANELTHLCQLVWAFSFASRLWPELEDKLQHTLRCIGTYLDNRDPPDFVTAQHQRWSSKERPTLVMQLEGISVVFKPPYWEVDAKGQLSGNGLYLSSYLQDSHPSSCVVHMAAFEYGFVHRLDIPSSGLVLTGTSFRGLAGLQWQMHTYSICREYVVLLAGIWPVAMQKINVNVQDFIAGCSHVSADGRPSETRVKGIAHSRSWSRDEGLSLVCISICTGRRHQIRVHVQWQGHPTVTDEKYSHRYVVSVMKPNLVANKACAARVRKREQEMLKSRIKNVKPQIDTRPPDSMALDHVRNNLKREQLLEERYHAIDRDNRILLQKMSDIMKTPSVKSGLGAQSSPAINTRDARKAELSRITQENLAILKRIQQAQPVYNHVEWDDSYRRTVERCKSSAARRAHRFGGMPFEFELPSKPVLVAGGFGGPAVMFLVTPFRNGLTLGATSPASAVELYQQVFAQGFARGWTGGAFTARAACPQFLCLGPAYHFYASFSGVGGGVLLTSLTETLIVYGAETKNAQMATNQKSPGSITSVHPSWKPFGPGFGIHVFRNVIATAGLRMFCSPCRTAIEKATGNSNSMTTLAGDFAGNVCAACLSAPVHQLYGYTVTTPELRTLPAAEQRERMVSFLKNQYLDTSNGRTRLSGLVPRDLFMRSMYVAVAYTMYSTVERTLVANWNSCEYPLTLTKKKVPTRSSSLTPLSGKANKGMATTTGSLGALAPGEVGQESAGDDLRYVLKEGKDINGVFYLCEMATDGRSLAITAYDAEQKTTLELLVNEKNHRRLYRDHNGDYRAIAAKLCLDGEQLYINHDGMLPDGKPERAA
ncbi:rluC [Symbiodinium necroappetens]|uniref:RluC protein n=1 Tax=Symbiodinium necroappetens TaxID=1628268 RepID=A0A812WQ16_9DINO|nr:rluC [Symbiodinium necroappetens]